MFKPSSKIFLLTVPRQYLFCGSFVLLMSCVCHAFSSVHCCLVVTWRERADFLALVCDVYCDFVTFPYGILRQVWYLIVLIPDPCCLSYFDETCNYNSTKTVHENIYKNHSFNTYNQLPSGSDPSFTFLWVCTFAKVCLSLHCSHQQSVPKIPWNGSFFIDCLNWCFSSQSKFFLVMSGHVPAKKQEMSQTCDECPQRNWSSTRHIWGKIAII